MLEPRAWDHQVETIELCQGTVNAVPISLRSRQVGGESHSGPFRIRIQVHRKHIMSVLNQPFGDRSAYSAAGSCYQRSAPRVHVGTVP